MNTTKSRSWTFPDGTTCQTKFTDFDDNSYCINGRCEKFSCNSSQTNYYKINLNYCPQNMIIEDIKQKWNSLYHQENGRDYKSIRLINENHNNHNNNSKNIREGK